MNHCRTFLCVAVAAALASGSSAWAKDGVFSGLAEGRNGDVPVQVTISQGKITKIEIGDWSETHPIADLPKVQIPQQIIQYQSLKPDVISGATLTSFGLIGAVKDAVRKAGLDPAAFSKPIPKPAMLTDTVEQAADIVIIGGGGAGLSAAVAAAKQGRSVLVVEKAHFLGGNTSVAGGNYNAADMTKEVKFEMTKPRRKIVDAILSETPKNDLHKALIEKVKAQYAEFSAKNQKGLFDSPEFHALQTWKAGDYQADLDLVYDMTQNSPKMEYELVDMGFAWRPSAEQVAGSLWPRANRSANFKSGVGFIDTFIKEIEIGKLPVKFLMKTSAQELIVKNGRVIGAKAKADNGRNYVLKASKGVILATGGFGANVEMRLKYDTIWDKKLGKGVNTTNVKAIQGDGMRMAEKIGADLIQMGNIQLLATTDPYTGASSSKASISTCMFVNDNGERFVNETGRRDVISRAALKQPGQHFYLLATSETVQMDKDGRNKYGIKISDLIKQKKVFKADSWDDLAKQTGINAVNLKKSVAKWIEFCADPKDDPFGRPSCDPEVRLDGKAPYYATIMAPSVHHTMGGVRVNKKAQVLDKKGNVIPGLWAAGEVTGGIHGANRVGGNAVPDALTNGKKAGLEASR